MLLLAFPCTASAQEWYENSAPNISDPFGINLYCRDFLGATYKMDAGRSVGQWYIILPKTKYDQIITSQNQGLIRKSRVIDRGKAHFLRNQLLMRADQKIPLLLELIPGLPHVASVATTAIDLLLEGSRNTAREVAAVMADGGLMQEVVRIEAPAPLSFLSTSIVYTATVNKETRSYMLSSSTFAVKVE